VIGVCWKWTARRVDVDPLTGAVHEQPRSHGPSPADEAALETALRLAAPGEPVVVVCAGPPEAEAALRDALAAGATRAVRLDGLPADAPSDRVAAALAGVLGTVRLVLTGDRSLDRGSGSVPAFVAAALGAQQALGAPAVEPIDPAPTVGGDDRRGVTAGSANRAVDRAVDPGDGGLLVTRRLDGGRRERVRVDATEGRPAVISVEGSAARLRRAPLPGVVAARTAAIEVAATGRGGARPGPAPATLVRTGPHRPRARLRPAPADADPHARILALTGAMTDRTPPVLVHLEPAAAAQRILEQLRQWGYEVPTGPGT
jgi:electron transfer flavoprotein beta subunit